MKYSSGVFLIKETQDAQTDAVSLWQSRKGTAIDTSLLISSTLRLKVKGLRWLPLTPNTSRNDTNPCAAPLVYRASSHDNTQTSLLKDLKGLERTLMCVVFPSRQKSVIPNASRTWLPRFLFDNNGFEERAQLERTYPAAFVAKCDKVKEKY